MSVKLELYKVFNEVAEVGNITLAAERLYISQSAVSQSIRQLEDQLQVRLFSRSARGVMLTREGQMLHEYTKKALDLLSSGEDKLAMAHAGMHGELIIGASDTVTKTYLLPRLEAFHKAYPAIKLRVLNGTSAVLLDYLRGGRADIAFVSEMEDMSAYSVRRCLDTHTIFVVSPDYECDKDKVYSLSDIADMPLILLEKTASSRKHLEEFFLKNGSPIQPEIELGSHNLLISLARIGLGVACVTKEFSESGLSRGIIVPLKTDFEIPSRAMSMCTLAGITPTVAVTRFMDFISALT